MSDIKNTVMVTFSILLGSFFSYLLQFFLGRNLSVADFGTFNTLLSITAVVGVPATVFGTSLIKKTAMLYSQKDSAKITALFWHSIVWSTALGVTFFGFFYIFRGEVFGYLKISDLRLILAFITYLSLSLVWAIPYYFLQGVLKYTLFSILVVMSSVFRFVGPLIMLMVSPSVLNVFLGIIFGLSISFIISLLFVKADIWPFSNASVSKDLIYILKFSLPVMAVNLCLMSLINSDMIAVRSLFSEQQAGYYAGVITLGKILLFGSTPVATVMYPKISSAALNGSGLKELFNKFAKFQVLVVGFGLLLFVFLPKYMALGFFGHKYLESVKYLPIYSVAIAFYVLVNFLVLFLLAVDKTDFYKVLIFLAFVHIILINKYTHGLEQVIYVNIGVMIASFVFLSYKSFIFLKKTELPLLFDKK